MRSGALYIVAATAFAFATIAVGLGAQARWAAGLVA